jgi:2-polyprenyl-3-methyl-5-hydroxy-6-metoxy-1,4-benzoquinol methylase
MDIAAKVLSRVMGRDVDSEELKVVAIFCGGGLFISLLAAMSFHVVLGADFF